jgi:hypothetical protein
MKNSRKLEHSGDRNEKQQEIRTQWWLRNEEQQEIRTQWWLRNEEQQEIRTQWWLGNEEQQYNAFDFLLHFQTNFLSNQYLLVLKLTWYSITQEELQGDVKIIEGHFFCPWTRLLPGIMPKEAEVAKYVFSLPIYITLDFLMCSLGYKPSSLDHFNFYAPWCTCVHLFVGLSRHWVYASHSKLLLQIFI